MQHIIRKQIIQLDLDNKKDSFNLQNKVSDYYQQEIIGLLENVFDDLTPDGEVVSIDRLEVDLGRFSLETFLNEIQKGTLLLKLRELLNEKIRTGHTGKIRHTTTKTQPETAFEQWLHYMRTGLLPWNLLIIDEEWRNRVLENLATDYKSVSILRVAIEKEGPLLKRIVLQHESAFLQKLVEILTAIKQN